mmetsp:Transcript_37543/g.117357  ORF Transcript_37543/g.117357 Transcript_37543/m.117357 type:complete len:86 (-) Transcript_37543:273-530(-)
MGKANVSRRGAGFTMLYLDDDLRMHKVTPGLNPNPASELASKPRAAQAITRTLTPSLTLNLKTFDGLYFVQKRLDEEPPMAEDEA